MNITELDSFKLSDAVKFHNRLNPKIWGKDEHLLPEVREKLIAIAADFQEFLGVSDIQVKDITVSGSNAAFSYTPHSDIDLHLVVEFPQGDEIYQELFNAKKYQYNDEHNLAISNIPVELYVQNVSEPPVSQGEYSVLNNDWIQVPRRKRAKIDDTCVRAKVEDLDARIHNAIKSGDADAMGKLWDKIKHMRQAGLDEHGEFGCENIAFKILRTNGCIKDLRDARTAALDKEMSLREQNKPVQRKVWGFAEDAGSTPDGVNPTTCMFLNEEEPSSEEIVNQFIQHTAQRLGIENMPTIVIHDDPTWSEQQHSFGMYEPETHTLNVSLPGRHLLDVLRTVAHELTHCRQHETEPLPAHAGQTGSDWENEANAAAGIIMRDFADAHPEYFDNSPLKESSGYIPTPSEKNDPRFKMALTVDVHPGQTGKEANKMALQTDKQGKPALLMKTANLRESLEKEFKLFEEQDLFEIKMTGKNLAKLASDIKGAKVGLEFEMIVPNASVEDDGDMEPDYDMDEPVRDIDEAVEFFDDGDYNGRADLRRLRDAMQEAYWEWKSEKLDYDWYNGDGFDYFREWLEGNDPFDEEEAQEEATNQLQAEYGDDISPEEFQTMLNALVEEKREAYVQEQWDDQSGNFDDARQEYEEDHRDDYDERDWLRSQGITYASDVESNFGYVTWPYYTSNSSEGEADIERIALEFMNDSGLPYDSVAVSSSYHGSYKKWVGNGWVNVGSNKPEDCFSIEPDGSLDGDSSDDVGLEFVSPPIPLEQVGDVMAKVQQWAARNGVYTGKTNKTSIHTNISIPGYNIKDLDYLKAALLLGDEYVLRQFDRIGNTYAKPAIEKIRQLVNQRPEKAQELLDTMKSQLNAEASKLIHSGITDKFTSINTKGNRIEFRSPGGDYLSDIADNPRKMQDTINRMVVAMDAAMDPNKYKEEYQKKLYKVLTGQTFGREAKSGAKQEPKKDTDDLLSIFSRYAAGELPKAALKSFVRQAQTERKLARGDMGGEKFWWNVKYNDQRMEVVATNKKEAKEVAAKEWGLTPAQADTITGNAITVLRPYDDSPVKAQVGEPEPVGRQSTANHNWAIRRRDSQEIVKTFQADDYMQAHSFLQQYKRDHNITDNSLSYGPYNHADEEPLRGGSGTGPYELYNRQTGEATYHIDPAEANNDADALNYLERYRRGSSNPANYGVRRRPVPGSTLDLQRQRAAQAQTNQGNWGIWIDGNNRFANQPGTYARGETPPLYRFPSREAAESWLAQQRAERAGLRRDIEVREIEPAREPVANIDLFPEIEPTQQGTVDQQQGGTVDVAGEQPAQVPRTLTTPGQGQQVFTGEWKVVDPDGNEIYRFSGVGNSQSDANRVAIQWLQRNPRHLQGGVEVLPVMG